MIRQLKAQVYMKKALLILALVALFMGWSNVSYAQCNPPYNFSGCFRLTYSSQAPLQAITLIQVLENIGGFLIIAAGIVAGIVIIVAGLMWMSAGSNTTRLANAKALFKNGIIGALILFAAGLIIQTIILLATNWVVFFS